MNSILRLSILYPAQTQKELLKCTNPMFKSWNSLWNWKILQAHAFPCKQQNQLYYGCDDTRRTALLFQNMNSRFSKLLALILVPCGKRPNFWPTLESDFARNMNTWKLPTLPSCWNKFHSSTHSWISSEILSHVAFMYWAHLMWAYRGCRVVYHKNNKDLSLPEINPLHFSLMQNFNSISNPSEVLKRINLIHVHSRQQILAQSNYFLNNPSKKRWSVPKENSFQARILLTCSKHTTR